MSLRATPDLLSTVAAAAPARVVKRLDGDRAVARAWTWSVGPDGGTVVTEGNETVTLAAKDGVVAAATDVVCSCLLSPRCFHVLAVVAALEIADAAPAGEPAASTPEVVVETATTTVSPSARAVAARARTVAADVLAAGARGVGAVLEGELLRLVHSARVEGLHRLAAAGLRVARDVRDLRGEAAQFAAATLVDDLHDLLFTAVLLTHLGERARVDPSVVGVARRAYQTIGTLRLYGVCTEPVVARGGMAGVVTHLLDERGGAWSIGDVQRGDIGRAIGAYDAAVAMGDTTVAHRVLSRAGLFVQDATASEDRRLGAGKQVKAVRAQNELGLRAEPIRARFAEPLKAQIARAYETLALPDDRRPRGGTLLFVRGSVLGWDDGALWLATADGPLRVIAPSAHASLAFIDNLRTLLSAEGLPLELVAHLLADAPRTLSLLAFGPGEPTEGAPSLVLPEDWRGMANAGFDTLVGAHLAGPLRRSPKISAGSPHGNQPPDPLAALRRRVERAALHGLRSLPSEATSTVDRERLALAKHTMRHGADVLGTLAASARRGRSAFADGWVAAASYARAATTAAWRDAW